MSASAQNYQLSLPTAILININIMLGAGIFINTPTLAAKAGPLGPFMYLFVGLLMLPLILSIAELLKIHPAGGFYTFAQKEMSPWMGFVSGWCYFTSKLASCMLMIHVSMTLLQTIFPSLQSVHTFVLDAFVVCTFTVLNLLNIKAGSLIQKLFIGFKTFPIFFAISTGLFLFQNDHFTRSTYVFEGLYSSLPLVVYAVIGFEAACSLSSKIKDANKNAPKAILISFGIVIAIATLYQAIFYGALGETLVACAGHCDIFPALIGKLFGEGVLSNKLEGILHLAIASSTLGAAYGIIFSNSWNLHTLAQNQHLLFSKFFTQLNKNSIPYLCVIVEGVLALMYLGVSQGEKVPLQQIGAFGCVIAYTFSIGALFQAINKEKIKKSYKKIALFGLVSCTILMSACLLSFFQNGMGSLITFSSLFLIGASMFWITSRKEIRSEVMGRDI